MDHALSNGVVCSNDLGQFSLQNVLAPCLSTLSPGVLLLNAVLTVNSGQANSHKSQGWEQLTDAVIRHLNEKMAGVVFILWGAYAQKKGAHINKVSCQSVLFHASILCEIDALER